MVKPDPTTDLLGHWIHILDGEYGKCGQITMVVRPEHYLVRMRPYNGAQPPHSQLMTNDDFCSDHDYYVAIFDTEAELDTWLAWMDTPTDDGRPRVVSMRKEPT
jgi:hypothetical protein